MAPHSDKLTGQHPPSHSRSLASTELPSWIGDHAQRRSELGLRAHSISIHAQRIALGVSVAFIGLGVATCLSLLPQDHIGGLGLLAVGIGLIRQVAGFGDKSRHYQ